MKFIWKEIKGNAKPRVQLRRERTKGGNKWTYQTDTSHLQYSTSQQSQEQVSFSTRLQMKQKGHMLFSWTGHVRIVKVETGDQEGIC